VSRTVSHFCFYDNFGNSGPIFVVFFSLLYSLHWFLFEFIYALLPHCTFCHRCSLHVTTVWRDILWRILPLTEPEPEPERICRGRWNQNYCSLQYCNSQYSVTIRRSVPAPRPHAWLEWVNGHI